MSASKFQVDVHSDDPLAELTIVDSRYKTRAHGVGHVSCPLPRGLYIARARSGDKTLEHDLEVDDKDVAFTFQQRGEVRSSAPLDASFEQARVDTINQAIAVTPNANAWTLLALRHAANSESPTPVFLPVQSASGFELRGEDGTLVTAFGAHPLKQTPTGHWVVALRLAPDWYRLAMPGDHGSHVMMPLYAGAQFSPSVFVELRADRSNAPRPDLDRVLVSYDDREFGIFRNVDRMRAIEAARRALVLGRNILTPALMGILFAQKFQDPMLGLFAAQLLLSDPNGGRHFAEVIRNTGNILDYPQHPDLVIARALGRQCGWWTGSPLPGDAEPLVAPPLLRASWEGMLRLKDRRNEVVSSPALRAIASSLIRSNVWVLWRETATPRAAMATREVGARRPKSVVSRRSSDIAFDQLISFLRRDPEIASTFKKELASEGYEGAPLSRSIGRTALQLMAESETSKIPRGYTKQIAHSLSVPVPLVADEIGSIAELLATRLKAKGKL